MTVQTNTNVASFNGDGANKVFPIGYKFNSAADLVVLLVDDVAVTTRILTLNSDFTVTGAGDDEGGTVTLEVAPTANQRLTIIRIVDILQLTDLRNQGKFYAEIHEDAFDLLTMIAQQHQSDIALSLRVAETDPEPARIPSVAQRAGKLLAFDAAGNPTTALPVADSSTELRQDLAGDNGAGHVSFKQPLAAALRRALDLKLVEHVSVRDFGAVGDGVTDDTVAIQAAFDSLAGAFNGWVRNAANQYYDSSTLDAPTARVHFPRGLYKITAEIKVPRGLLITGENARNHGGSRIKQFGTGGKYCFNLYGTLTANGQYIADQQIDGLFFSAVDGGGIRAYKPAGASEFYSMGSCSISNCFFLDIQGPLGTQYAAIDVEYLERCENNTFDAIEAIGLRAAHVSLCTGNAFFFNGRGGIILDLSRSSGDQVPSTIVGNTFMSCGSDGTGGTGAYQAAIGIIGTGPTSRYKGLCVTGNTIVGLSNAGVHGIVADNVILDGAAILNNPFLDLQGDPIRLSAADDCTIGNTYKGCSKSSEGVYVLGVLGAATNCKLINNSFTGNGGAANIHLGPDSTGNLFNGTVQDVNRFDAPAGYGRRINDFAPTPGNVTTTGPATGWTAPVLSGTWVAASASNPVQYRLDELGRVTMRGKVQGGTAGTAIFTLPAGLRPAAGQYHAFICKSGGATGFAVVDVTDTGNVTVSAFSDGSSTNLDIGQIAFYPEG